MPIRARTLRRPASKRREQVDDGRLGVSVLGAAVPAARPRARWRARARRRWRRPRGSSPACGRRESAASTTMSVWPGDQRRSEPCGSRPSRGSTEGQPAGALRPADAKGTIGQDHDTGPATSGVVILSDRALGIGGSEGARRLPVPSVLAAGAIHTALTAAGLRGRTDIVVDAAEASQRPLLAMTTTAARRRSSLARDRARRGAGGNARRRDADRRGSGRIAHRGVGGRPAEGLARMAESARSPRTSAAPSSTASSSPPRSSRRCFRGRRPGRPARGWSLGGRACDGQIRRLRLPSRPEARPTPARPRLRPVPGRGRAPPLRPEGRRGGPGHGGSRLRHPGGAPASVRRAARRLPRGAGRASPRWSAMSSPRSVRGRAADGRSRTHARRAAIRRLGDERGCAEARGGPEADDRHPAGWRRCEHQRGRRGARGVPPGPGRRAPRRADRAGHLGSLSRDRPGLAPRTSSRSRSPRVPSPARAGSFPRRRPDATSPPSDAAGRTCLRAPAAPATSTRSRTSPSRSRTSARSTQQPGSGSSWSPVGESAPSAAGVAKAGASYVHLSGNSGGTGGGAISSIKLVGAPWELGLAEVRRVSLLDDLPTTASCCAQTAACRPGGTSSSACPARGRGVRFRGAAALVAIRHVTWPARSTSTCRGHHHAARRTLRA